MATCLYRKRQKLSFAAYWILSKCGENFYNSSKSEKTGKLFSRAALVVYGISNKTYRRVGVLCKFQESWFLNNLVNDISGSLLTNKPFTELIQCVPHSQYRHGYCHLITFDPFIRCVRSKKANLANTKIPKLFQ